MNIITGYRNEAHVTAQQDRDTNMGIFGSGIYILAVGSQMTATVISANQIDIADGIIVAEGCTAEVPRGTTESLAITNGDQGMLRKDLIVLRYTKNSGTGVEDMSLVVIDGTPAASSPALPSYTSGSIADGDTTVDFPLYTVNIDGITIDSVESMVTVSSLAQASTVTSLQSTVSTLNTKVGSVAMGTTATTITGAIKELLTRITTLTSNLTSAISRIAAVETKTGGIVKTSTSNVNANSNDYRQLSALSTYMVVVNAASTSNTTRGLYLVGSTSSKVLGIKTISSASDVTLSDAGNGLLKIVNGTSVTLRVTVITMYT